MAILRNKTQGDFTIIQNNILRDRRTSKILKLIASLNGREEYFQEYYEWKKNRIKIKTSKHHRYFATLEVYDDHCVLKAGSRIKLTSGDTIDPNIKKIRDNIIQVHCDANGILRDDVPLASPYVAAVVLIGNKVNADSIWE